MTGRIMMVAVALGLLLARSTQAEEAVPVELSIQVTVDPIPKPLKPFEIDKDERVFGKTVENPWLRVDPATRGLADVLIWTFDAKRLPLKERATRTITFEKGNYWHFVQVASRGDLLQYENKHPVADNFVSEFGDGVISARVTQGPYVLDKYVDNPIPSRSSIYPWPQAFVYVEDMSCCAATNLRGEAKMRYADWLKRQDLIELRCWHPHYGYLSIKSAEPSTEILKHGRIRIAPEALKDKRLKIVARAKDETNP